MQIFFRDNKLLIGFASVLILTTLAIVVHKIDIFSFLHIFPSLMPFYAIFFSVLCLLIFFLYKSTLKNKIYPFFVLTAPSIIILIIGVNLTRSLHYIFYLIIGLWIIALGSYLIKRINIKRKNSHTFKNSTKTTPLYTPIVSLTLFGVIITYLIFGLYHLNKSSYVDEKLWTYGTEKRIEKYYPNILQRDWKNTRPSDKPGITLAAISGIGLIWVTPSDFYHNFANTDALMQMLFVMRLPLLLFGALMLLIFYHIIGKLFNPQISILATITIALSPIIIGISRLINPDALSWIFMPLTFFLYFLYIKTKNYKWLYISGIFLGLSLLTKYIANLLIVFFILEIFTEAILLKIRKDDIHQFLRNKIIDIAILIFIALATFYIFYPGTWVKPDRLLIGTLWSQSFLPVWKPFVIFCALLIADHFTLHSKIFAWTTRLFQKVSKLLYFIIPIVFLTSLFIIFINTYLPTTLINFEILVAAPKGNSAFSIFDIFLSGFYTTAFSISILVFTGIIIGSIALFFNNQKHFSQFIVWNALLFIIIYYIGSATSLVASTVRYQIILYPFIFVISAYGWYWIIMRFKKPSLYIIFITIVIITSCYTLFTIKPHYASYSSPLLPQKYIVNPKDMGDGNYEAGEYLNTLPNAQNLKIWSDRNGVCVIFDGYCNSSPHMEYFSENGTDYDYYVISRASEYRIKNLTSQRLQKVPSYNLRLDKLYDMSTFIFELHPANRNATYIKIIPGDSITVLENN